MYRVRFEHANAQIQAAVNQVLPTMNAVIAYGSKSNFGAQLRGRWFKDQANAAGLLNKLKSMDAYINKNCEVMSFVVKTQGQRVDGADVEAGDYAQVMNAPILSSGTRVYILPSFGGQDAKERVNTVCHELSHRVLGTTDCPGGGAAVYGRTAALALGGANSIECAEVFGYFYMELAGEMGLLH